MSSSSADRMLLGRFLLVLYVNCLRWSVGVAGTFYIPSDRYQAGPYYYNSPLQSFSWGQLSANGYNYYQRPNPIVSMQPENVADYSGRVNYYGAPDDGGYRTRLTNDPYIRRQWNNYYQNYNYPSASASGWNDRRDGTTYYSKRRQDSFSGTTPATTSPSPRPSVPRKKKLFVPNVWG